eukprot:scaffold1541_cov256-Pinguiococcus_pyrenoidosus.AAC.21
MKLRCLQLPCSGYALCGGILPCPPVLLTRPLADLMQLGERGSLGVEELLHVFRLGVQKTLRESPIVHHIWRHLPQAVALAFAPRAEMAVLAKRRSAASLSCRPTDSVDEELRRRREAEVDDVVEKRHVDPPRGNVRDQQDPRGALPELLQVHVSSVLIHPAVDYGTFKTGCVEQLEQKLTVMPGGREDDGHVVPGYHLVQNEEQRRQLFPAPKREEDQAQLLGDLLLNVQANQVRVLKSCSRELHQLRRQRRREKQSLPRRPTAA